MGSSVVCDAVGKLILFQNGILSPSDDCGAFDILEYMWVSRRAFVREVTHSYNTYYGHSSKAGLQTQWLRSSQSSGRTDIRQLSMLSITSGESAKVSHSVGVVD